MHHTTSIPSHDMRTFSRVRDICTNARRVALCAHRNPDGDAIGSTQARWRLLTNLWIHVDYYYPTEVADILRPFLGDSTYATSLRPDRYDAVICMDTASIPQLVQLWTERNQYLVNHPQLIVIDHHASNPWYGVFNLIDSTASSTCEYLGELLYCHDPSLITPEIATALFLGISTDTGNFLYERHSPRTFAISSFLLNAGADKDRIMKLLYRSHQYTKIQYLSVLLSRIEKKWMLLTAWFSDAELQHHNIPADIAELFLQLFCSIQHDGVFVLVKLDYHLGEVRCSLRSKTDAINVSALAERLWWWGHIRAAWCKLSLDRTLPVEENVERTLTVIQTHL